ncbi:MAG: adenosylcobinamide-GDP ribazoletransferase [Coleofasciculaceae cyanobacterium]
MKPNTFPRLAQWGYQLWRSLIGAVTFYTCLPVPQSWAAEFRRIARWAPLIGLLIGTVLAVLDVSLQKLGVPILTRSAILVVSWIALTGGLHLDGVIDTADGLAVADRNKRLEVMTDSVTGAFGAMAAVALLMLKITAIADLENYRWLALMGAAGWGRWGQVVAIAFYPYLKPTGKGAFHKQAIKIPQDLLSGLFLLFGLSTVPLMLSPNAWWIALALVVGGGTISLSVAAWFGNQLGGHTGDTYGAVVEWTEALFLCLFTALWS